jgi:hypothetical protein
MTAAARRKLCRLLEKDIGDFAADYLMETLGLAWQDALLVQRPIRKQLPGTRHETTSCAEVQSR